MSMPDASERAMAQRMQEIESAWMQLVQTVSEAPAEAVATRHDAAGWTALDHLAHVSAWERTALFPLLGRPRHEGAGVTATEFELDFDPLNEIIRQQTAGQSAEQVLHDANHWHRRLIESLQRATPGELLRTTSALAPDAKQAADPRSILAMVDDNTVGHYREHQGYIEKILAS